MPSPGGGVCRHGDADLRQCLNLMAVTPERGNHSNSLVKASFDAPVALEHKQLSRPCVTSVNESTAQFGLQQIIQLLRVGFASRGFHGLADEEAKQLVLA